MKNQALFSSTDKSKKLNCRLLQFLFGTLKVNACFVTQSNGLTQQNSLVYKEKKML